MTIKVDDEVLVLPTAPKCSIHRGQIGKIVKIRHSAGLANTMYIVRFPDARSELHKEKDLQKVNNV